DGAPDLADVLEAFIRRCETHVGYVSQMLEFAHPQFTKIARTDLAPAAGQQLFFAARLGGIPRFGVHPPLAQALVGPSAQLGRLVLDPRAIALDHRRHQQLGPLVGRETTVAGDTAPAAPYGVTLFGNPRVDDLGVETATERTFHGSLCP